MSEQLMLFSFFVGFGLVSGSIIGGASALVIYDKKKSPSIGWVKIVGGVGLVTLLMPGNDIVINSLFGLHGAPINWGNWLILAVLLPACVTSFKSVGRKARAR